MRWLQCGQQNNVIILKYRAAIKQKRAVIFITWLCKTQLHGLIVIWSVPICLFSHNFLAVLSFQLISNSRSPVMYWLQTPPSCVRSTYRPSALTRVGGGTLDFMLWFRIFAVQGVGIRRNSVITFWADGGHGHACSKKKETQKHYKLFRSKFQVNPFSYFWDSSLTCLKLGHT